MDSHIIFAIIVLAELCFLLRGVILKEQETNITKNIILLIATAKIIIFLAIQVRITEKHVTIQTIVEFG
jgi:hypothetical protein